MTKPLLIYTAWHNRFGQYGIEHGCVYFGEHAKIMRLAFNIPDNMEIMVKV